MLAWYFVAGLAGLSLGALLTLGGCYLLSETLLKIYDINENPSLDQGAEPEFDPEEERLDLLAIRDLLTGIDALGRVRDDDEHATALRELLDASDRARDRFEDLLDDLDDEPKADAAEPAEAAV